MEQNKTKAFYIANELMTSERVFVDVLRLLNVDFREYLQKARRESKNGLMPDSDCSRLFNNLPELQTLNEVCFIMHDIHHTDIPYVYILPYHGGHHKIA